jgi:hypothetical protein
MEAEELTEGERKIAREGHESSLMYAKEKANEGEREGESCWRCGEKGREG